MNKRKLVAMHVFLVLLTVFACSCVITPIVTDVRPHAPASDGSPQIQKTTCTLKGAQIMLSYVVWIDKDQCKSELIRLGSAPAAAPPK